MLDTRSEAFWIAGLIAGEGTFGAYGRTFRFAVTLGDEDELVCERLKAFFGIGSLSHYPPRKPGYEGEVVFQIRKLSDLVSVVVPFMDEHLLESYKRTQYLEWREKLLSYWERDAKRQRVCEVEGCDRIRRAHGLCRHHLHAQAQAETSLVMEWIDGSPKTKAAATLLNQAYENASTDKSVSSS